MHCHLKAPNQIINLDLNNHSIYERFYSTNVLPTKEEKLKKKINEYFTTFTIPINYTIFHNRSIDSFLELNKKLEDARIEYDRLKIELMIINKIYPIVASKGGPNRWAIQKALTIHISKNYKINSYGEKEPDLIDFMESYIEEIDSDNSVQIEKSFDEI